MELIFYKHYNNDLLNMTDDELINHYNEFGQYEDRVYNAKSFSNKYFNNDVDYNDENLKIFCLSPILKNIIINKKNNEKIQILIFSNCQGHHIPILLNKINIFTKYFNFTCIVNYIGMNDEQTKDFHKLLNNIDIYIYQPVRDCHTTNSRSILKIIPDNVIKISMPYIYCNWLWLFGYNIKESIEISNTLLNDKEYISNSLDKFNIIKRMERSLNILKEKELNTDIKVADFIINNYKKKRLFHTCNHITKPMIINIIYQVLNILCININEKIDESIDIGIYNQTIFHPISKTIQNILELEYFDEEADQFYIDYIYDYINKLPVEKYYNNENNKIYNIDFI